MQSGKDTHNGERTHNVNQQSDTHIFKGGGGRTHNVTQRTDTHIFLVLKFVLTQTDQPTDPDTEFKMVRGRTIKIKKKANYYYQ